MQEYTKKQIQTDWLLSRFYY